MLLTIGPGFSAFFAYINWLFIDSERGRLLEYSISVRAISRRCTSTQVLINSVQLCRHWVSCHQPPTPARQLLCMTAAAAGTNGGDGDGDSVKCRIPDLTPTWTASLRASASRCHAIYRIRSEPINTRSSFIHALQALVSTCSVMMCRRPTTTTDCLTDGRQLLWVLILTLRRQPVKSYISRLHVCDWETTLTSLTLCALYTVTDMNPQHLSLMSLITLNDVN